MPKFRVSVEKKLYFTGAVEVTAKNTTEAQRKVDARISKSKLRMSDVKWNEGEYEDFSFSTTGDVEDA
jgi:hypothetical protein